MHGAFLAFQDEHAQFVLLARRIETLSRRQERHVIDDDLVDVLQRLSGLRGHLRNEHVLDVLLRHVDDVEGRRLVIRHERSEQEVASALGTLRSLIATRAPHGRALQDLADALHGHVRLVEQEILPYVESHVKPVVLDGVADATA